MFVKKLVMMKATSVEDKIKYIDEGTALSTKEKEISVII